MASNFLGLPEKYWLNPSTSIDNIVVIHVCDENRHVNRDFCCRRDILVKNMKYFESFLTDNESGYEDIDISVHCDVEIFEWLMAYVHSPDSPPPLEKSIVVSILISSEFLQMQSLVDLCLENISSSLSEIIKLPIDLSCISDKLINRLAYLTHPKTLAQTKDRKDKILNKLYKRRVELDFSRKTVPRGSNRSMAASLTCCQYCGSVYLENWSASLICSSSKPAIDFRGRLVRRHQAIPSWSLTGYLKSLHAGGMPWECIYWHVWAACIVLQPDSSDVMISALDSQRYTIEADGILILPRSSSTADPNTTTTSNSTSYALSSARQVFSLDTDDDFYVNTVPLKMAVTVSSIFDAVSPLDSHITPSLNPLRPPTVLTQEIFELLTSQAKVISGQTHKSLIETTERAQMQEMSPEDTFGVSTQLDFYDMIWCQRSTGVASVDEDQTRGRGRSHSPAPAPFLRDARKTGASVSAKWRQGADTAGGAATDGTGQPQPLQDDDAASASQRRSRSTSIGGRKAREHSASRKPKSVRRKSGSRMSGKDQTDSNKDPENIRMFEVLSTFPPDMLKLIKNTKGPIYGVWIVPHPLQLHPNTYYDSLSSIQEMTNISESKRLEWELDLVREYDEKRMDAFEAFLVSCRDYNIDGMKPRRPSLIDKLKFSVNAKRKEEERNSRVDYYRDRGRQPHKY